MIKDQLVKSALNIIRLYGNDNTRIGEIVERHNSRISNWKKHGIPDDCKIRLLEHAKKHAIDLQPIDFFYPGRLDDKFASQEREKSVADEKAKRAS